MSRQARSLFFPTGRDDSPGLLAQIFFPLDRRTSAIGRELDSQDQDVLDRLVHSLELPLVGRRVELVFLGHADFRGNPGYNMGLGLDRAKAVKQYVDRRLSANPLYSSWSALSRGERNAAQPVRRPDGHLIVPTADQMDLDRRVDVLSSYVPRAVFVPPIVVEGAVPTVRRLVFRRFRKEDHEGRQFTENPDPNRDDERELIRALISGDLFSNEPAGEEEMRARRVAQIPATHRVNRVIVDIESRHTVDPTVEMFFTKTDITYQWGQPERFVRIEERYHGVDFHGRAFRHEPEFRTVPRERADPNSFLFPPNPD